MLRYLMKLRHRKGFTLTELIIVIAIIAILMGCVAAFSGPIRQMVKFTSGSTDALTANKIIGDYLENRLAFADYIDIYYSVDSANTASLSSAGSNTKLSALDAFDRYKGKDDTTNKRDKSGVLILRYQPNATEPEKSTYVLYDYPITSTSTGYEATIIDAATADLNTSGAVFDDAFYANSQNLIIAPTEIQYNNSRGTLNMAFQIIPYDCSEDYLSRKADGSLDSSSQYIKPETLSTYYSEYITHAAHDETCTVCDTSYGLNDIRDQRSGAIEKVSFSLNNIKVADEKKFILTTDASGKEYYAIDYDEMNDKDLFQWHAREPGTGTGTDVLIYYHIPYYGK